MDLERDEDEDKIAATSECAIRLTAKCPCIEESAYDQHASSMCALFAFKIDTPKWSQPTCKPAG